MIAITMLLSEMSNVVHIHGPSGRINTQSQIRFCSDLEPFIDRRRAQRLLFTLWDKKNGFVFNRINQPNNRIDLQSFVLMTADWSWRG